MGREDKVTQLDKIVQEKDGVCLDRVLNPPPWNMSSNGNCLKCLCDVCADSCGTCCSEEFKKTCLDTNYITTACTKFRPLYGKESIWK